jgi:hypothetical protein
MATRYWVGGTGTWDTTTTTNWSTTSGGSGGASVPTSTDDAIFNSASSSGSYTVTVPASTVVVCANLTMSAPASGTLSFVGNSNVFQLYGDLTIAASGISTSTWQIYCYKTVTQQTITTNNVSIVSLQTSGSGGISLGSDITCSAGITASAGTFTSNNYAINSPFFATGSTTKTVNLGTSTITCSGTGAQVQLTGTNTTLSAASATFTFTNTSAKTLNCGTNAVSLGTVKNLGSGALTIASSSGVTVTIGTIINSVTPSAFTFTAGATYAVTNFTVSGTSGNLVTIISSTSGTAATLSKSSGTVSSNYLSLKDSTATGGAAWYAGANSTNVSGNTGWIFTNAPATNRGNFLMFM